MTPAADDTTIQCPLCGWRFAAAELNCHAGCPLSRECRVICCPNCALSFLDPRRPPRDERPRKGFWRLPWKRTTARP